jgi:hypothetical protein
VSARPPFIPPTSEGLGKGYDWFEARCYQAFLKRAGVSEENLDALELAEAILEETFDVRNGVPS